MNTKLLIDAIVQQTTVLIAQLSTAAGIRAPLAHVADRVFVDLAREIERQGVGRKVVADMFGLALRTYQKRVRRLAESASWQGRTLWEAVYEHVALHPDVRRSQIMERFRNDSQDDVGAVLNDLVSSGLVQAERGGVTSVYRVVSAGEQQAALAARSLDAFADMVWLTIYRARKIRLSALRGALAVTASELQQALALLEAGGVVHRCDDSEDPELRAENLEVLVDSSRGWEVAVFDHFSTVAAAIASKVRRGAAARGNDLVGGTTVSFDIRQGHPFEHEVLGLLARTRLEVDALWERVASYNKAHPVADEQKTKVSFYFGQNVEEGETPGTDLQGES
jgi:hypothetical protein